MLLMNSAAGIVLGRKVDSFKEGVEIAEESISSGEAYEKQPPFLLERRVCCMGAGV
jgi:anthranilate phosphoribosyltransferase